MSAKILGQVWDYVLTPEQQIVLLAYADHADHNGEHAWPSIPLLAWKTGLSERTIYRVIRGEKARAARRGRKAAPRRARRSRSACPHPQGEATPASRVPDRPRRPRPQAPIVSGMHRDDGAAPLTNETHNARGDGGAFRDDGGARRPATVVLSASEEPSVEPSSESSGAPFANANAEGYGYEPSKPPKDLLERYYAAHPERRGRRSA